MRKTLSLSPWLVLAALAPGACGGDDDSSDSKKHVEKDAAPDQTDSSTIESGTDASDEALPDVADAKDPGISSVVVSTLASTVMESETQVATAANGFVVVTWIAVHADGTSDNGYTFSKDDGDTFSPPELISAPDGRVSSDPVVFADPSSNLYLSFVAFHRDSSGQPYDMRVYVAQAPAGTITFGAPIDVTGGPVTSDSVDKPWGIADKDGRIYITWLDTGEPRMRIAVGTPDSDAGVDGGGIGFVTYPIDDGQGFRNLIFPCIDDLTGRLYVTYHPLGGIGLRSSDDQGQTWPNATAVALQSDEDAMFDDPTCAAHDGEIWIAYGIGTAKFATDESSPSNHIRIAHSTDGGLSFSDYWFAEDAKAGTKFLHPQLARDTSGRLTVVYYAGGESDPDPKGSFRISQSNDGGKTWSDDQTVLAPLTFQTARDNLKWLGDYVGLATRGTRRYVSFADNATGKSRVRFFSAL